jgi:murein DD-endopeptidase MepM/ murein hydrolase activator NlpD
VTAPDSGVVHFAGQVVDRPVLSIEHEGGILSSFEPVKPSVAAGDPVERGEAIGILQSGHGDCGTCLHLGARIDGEYVNPLLLLGELQPAILLPTKR